MLAKVIATLILFFGVWKPELFSKITESWKFGRRQPTKLNLIITRIMCVVAIVSIWIFIPV